MAQCRELSPDMPGDPFNAAAMAFEEVSDGQQAQGSINNRALTDDKQARGRFGPILPVETSSDRSGEQACNGLWKSRRILKGPQVKRALNLDRPALAERQEM